MSELQPRMFHPKAAITPVQMFEADSRSYSGQTVERSYSLQTAALQDADKSLLFGRTARFARRTCINTVWTYVSYFIL